MSASSIHAGPVDARAPRGAREGVIAAVLGPRLVRVELAGTTVDATVATSFDHRPAAGDRVLVLCEDGGAWVLGVIGALRPVAAGAPRLRAADGTHAVLADDGRTLSVRSAAGEVLFTHDARTGRSTVVGRELSVRAATSLALEAAQRVAIRAPHVSLSASDGEALELAEHGTSLRSARLTAALGEGTLRVVSGVLAAERLETAVKKARTFVDVLEVRAGRVVERAKETFREVDGVAQTRAGRIRTVAKSAYQVLAERATIKAEQDLELMGEKIHLA